MTFSGLLRRLFRQGPTLPTITDSATPIEAVRIGLSQPSEHFTYRGLPYPWPAPDEHIIFLPDMVFRVGRHDLGFVERAYVLATGTAHIGHIATGIDFQRQGLGPALARAFSYELQVRYGVHTIVFDEDSSKYREAGYATFFRKLGCIEQARCGTNSSWKWNL